MSFLATSFVLGSPAKNQITGRIKVLTLPSGLSAGFRETVWSSIIRWNIIY